MSDQTIDAVMAAALHADASRAHPLGGWAVVGDLPEYPGKMVGRRVTNMPFKYVLLADSLADLRAQLPPDLSPQRRQPADPPDLLDHWLR